MWVSRVLAFLVIAALAAFGAGALGLSTHRDSALTETGAGRAAAESRALAAEVTAAIAQHRRAADAALRSNELATALGLLTTDMPAHVRKSIVDPAMQKLASLHRPYNFVLVDAVGQPAGASAADLTARWDVPLAELDRLADGKSLKTSRNEQWAIVLNVPWALAPGAEATPPAVNAPAPKPGRLVVLGPQPADLAIGLFQETRSPDTLVLLADAKAIGPGADSPLAKAVTDIFPGKVTPVDAGGTRWQATRTLVPGVNELYVVVAWPAPTAPSFAELGGLVGVFKRISLASPVTQSLLGAAFLAWLVLMVAMSAALKRVARRLEKLMVDGRAAFPQAASQWPGWLRGALEGLNELVSVLSRVSSEKPLHSSVAAPTRPVQGLAPVAADASAVGSSERRVDKPAERSSEKSAEKSSEKSAERSAERSTEASTERSTERVPERTPDRLAEKPPEKTAERAKPKPPRPQPPPTPLPETARTQPKLPALDREDPEPETQTDIELRPAAVGHGLLSQLREEKALPSSSRAPAKHENTAIRPVPAELLSAMRDEASSGRGTGVGPAPQPLSVEEEAYFESVWKEFAATKHICGEAVEPADFRKFRAKLIRTRAQLVERFKCRDVRFRVYIKDAKAALKASPILEEDAEDVDG